MSSMELTMWRVFFAVEAEKANSDAIESAEDARVKQWVNSSD